MATILRNLRIDDVSSVDVGAGRGVKVVLKKKHDEKMHRDGVPTLYGKAVMFGKDVSGEAIEYLKREFSDEKRKELADKGHALKDGSFPIENKGDLKNAVEAVGRAKNPSKAKAHIKARAKALGAEDLLPESWSKRLSKSDILTMANASADRSEKHQLRLVKALGDDAPVCKNAVDFDGAVEVADASEDAWDLMNQVRQALYALDCSVASILGDADVADKRSAIAESYQQFRAHLDGLNVEDEDTEKNMPIDEKNLDERIAKTVTAVLVKAGVIKETGTGTGNGDEKDAAIAKLQAELAIAQAVLKMSDKHKRYMDSLGSDTEKKKFSNMSEDDRDQEMEKTRKRAEDDPIYKRQQSEIAELRKALGSITDERDLDVAKRDAKAMGFKAADAGEVVMKARKGDPEALKKMEQYVIEVAKANKAADTTSVIFAEFGKSGGAGFGGSDGTADVMQEFTALAEDLRKRDPSLTQAQAFDKVYNDPANKELRSRESAQRMAKIHRTAG